MIEKIFHKDHVDQIKTIVKTANLNGASLFLVGGIVRDALMGKAAKDIDIVVVGNVMSLIPILQEKMFCKVVKSNSELRTATLEFSYDLVIDFASTRQEVYGIRKGIPMACHFGCPIKDDVKRRDFTINSIAISLNNYDFGRIVDFTNGRKDLEARIIRVLHDKSFIDDPSRIVRAFKFAHRLGFKMDEHTKELYDNYLNNIDYSVVVSPTRIKKEFYSVFEMNDVEVMQDFIDKKIYTVLTDKINTVDFQKMKETIDQYNIKENIGLAYFLSLFYRKDNFNILKHINFTRQEIKIIQDLKFAEELEGKFSDLEIYQQYSTRSQESLAMELLVKNNKNIRKYFESLTNVKIEITGDDLMLMGVPESKDYSLIFDKVLEEKIKGNLPDKISELKFVRTLLINRIV